MTERNRRRERRNFFMQGLTVTSLALLLLPGCLAQQADLKDVERTLGTKIQKLDQQTAKLDQREKDLLQAISKAKLDVDKLVSETRARLSNEISMVREAELPQMKGGLETTSHKISEVEKGLDDVRAGWNVSTKRLASLEKMQSEASTAAKADREMAKGDRDRLREDLMRELPKEFNKSLDATSKRLDTMTTTIGTMAKTLGGRLDEHEKTIHTDGAKIQQFDLQTRQIESDNRSLLEQMAQYKKALDDFKKVLTGLGEKVVQEEQRSNELSFKLLNRSEALTNKVEMDAKATTTHLQDVNRSVGSVAKALETMGGQVMTRVEEQDRRMDEMIKSLAAVDAHVGLLTQTVAQLRSEHEQAVKNTVSLGGESSSQPPRRESVGSTEQAGSSSQNSRSVSSGESIPSTPNREAGGAVVQARDVYDRHITSFKQGNLDAALQGFAFFLTQYPSSDLAPNAQYWLGECYYGKGDYTRAIEAFDRVKMTYPMSEKVPAALLKKGFAYLALKDRYRASSVWRQVVDGYPRTPEAGKAIEKLAQLKQIR